MIRYDRFWQTLKRENVSTYALRENYNVSPSILTRMKNNEYLNLRTVEDLCKILECRIEDIAEYVPDE